MNELVRLSAVEAVSLLARREICASELVDAAAERIEAVDGDLNALPIRCFERARERAKHLARSTGGNGAGVLCGLPIAVKDYNDVA
ncbi:MAG: amidase family protein, partial [Aestuariivirgaceae bacterium]